MDKSSVLGIIETILSKVLSGRFIILVTSIVTYCVVISNCLTLVANKTIEVETFLGLFAGLTGIVSTIVTFYFMRTDRDKTNITNP